MKMIWLVSSPLQSKSEEWDGLFVDIGSSDIIANQSVIQVDIDIPEAPVVCFVCVCVVCVFVLCVCVCMCVCVCVCVCVSVCVCLHDNITLCLLSIHVSSYFHIWICTCKPLFT